MAKYSDFITQPLTKGMFVPCDENGEVLGELTGQDFLAAPIVHAKEEIEQYQQAKERVLFEGWRKTQGTIRNSLGECFAFINEDKTMVVRFDAGGNIVLGNPARVSNILAKNTIEQAINAGVKLYLK